MSSPGDAASQGFYSYGVGRVAQIGDGMQIVRRLVRAGPTGISAGTLAGALKVSPSNLSFHLKELDRAGLIVARREARSILDSADYKSLNGLIRYLMEDCCAARPEVCTPALTECCAPAPASTRRRESIEA